MGDASSEQPVPAPRGHDDGRFATHARTVMGLTFASRVSGLAREAVCARMFGTSGLWSAWLTAFIIPNLFRRLFRKAQKRIERKHYKQRLDLMNYDKNRQEMLQDLGADPYVD